MSQQSEIKKLSILIDYQKHQLRKYSVPCRDVPASNNSSPSPNDCENGSSVAVNRRSLKSTKAVSARKPPVSHCNSIEDSDTPRSQPASLLKPSPSAPPCPQVAVIGSSIVHGVGLRLNKCGVDAVTYTCPGYEVPQITERISSIQTKAYQPDTVVLQCGRYDLQNNRPPAEVMAQIDILVKEVERCRLGGTVVVNKIPPCGHDDTLLHNISFVNNLISNMARDDNQSVLCLDPCPKMFKYRAKEGVHLNPSGKRFFVYELAKSLINFHWPQLQGTR